MQEQIHKDKRRRQPVHHEQDELPTTPDKRWLDDEVKLTLATIDDVLEPVGS